MGYFRIILWLMLFHVDLDAFFASIEQRDNPKLAGKPVVVGGPAFAEASSGKPSRRGVVAAASYTARKYGIHSAMPLYKALILCPKAIVIEPHFSKYNLASKTFYKILSSYSPFLEPISIDEAYLSFYGFEEYYENLPALATKIKQDIQKEIGITASIGIAANKVVAKVASNYQKPDGLTVVAIGGEKAFLAKLPIGDLPGIGIKTEEKLTGMGITTIGQLSQARPGKLVLLFGRNGIYLSSAANGLGETELVLAWQKKSLGAETTFSYSSSSSSFLEQTLYFLSLRVASDLRKEGKLAGGVVLKLRTSLFQTKTHQAKLAAPSNSTRPIFEQAKMLLYTSWDQKTALRLIGISTFGLTTGVSQPSLFEQPQKVTRHIEAALDLIRKKHGFWSIIPGVIFNQKTTLRKLSRAD